MQHIQQRTAPGHTVVVRACDPVCSRLGLVDHVEIWKT